MLCRGGDWVSLRARAICAYIAIRLATCTFYFHRRSQIVERAELMIPSIFQDQRCTRWEFSAPCLLSGLKASHARCDTFGPMLVHCDSARRRLEADSAIHMATTDHAVSSDDGAVEAANLVAVVVLLEEKTRATRSPVTFVLAVCNRSGESHRRAVFRIGVANVAVTAVGEGYLRIGHARDKVLRIIAHVCRRVGQGRRWSVRRRVRWSVCR